MPADDTDRHHHDGRHLGAPIEEWVFAAWTPDARTRPDLGPSDRRSARRGTGRRSLASGRPLLHITDFDVPVRADPFIVKGEALWAEHHCDAAMRAVVDRQRDVLPRPSTTPMRRWVARYGVPDPDRVRSRVVRDSGRDAARTDGDRASIDVGYEQIGVVHGAIEILGEPRVELVEVPAHRWHRWTTVSTVRPNTASGR